jgi:hypothetical protein
MLKKFNGFVTEWNIIDSIAGLIEEKLRPSVAKQYMNIKQNGKIIDVQTQIWNNLQQHDKFIDASKRQDRLYFDFTPDLSSVEVSVDYSIIREVLDLLGYEIKNYIQGTAIRSDNNQEMKIGKILNKAATQYDKNKLSQSIIDSIYQIAEAKLDDKEFESMHDTQNPLGFIKNLFDSDEFRTTLKTIKENNVQIVFSRHSYDIAGMSTDRGWTSCMDLLSSKQVDNTQYISKDIKYGTFIAYAIAEDDKNIENPIARLLCRPFINAQDSEDIIFVAENKVYGTVVENFKTEIKQILTDVQSINIGKYDIQSKVYCDSDHQYIEVSEELQRAINNNQDITSDEGLVDEFLFLCGVRNYEYHQDGVEIFNKLRAGDYLLDNLKNFQIYITQLPLSIRGSTQEILMKRNKYDTSYLTLEGLPDVMPAGLFISGNKNIKSLKHCPNVIEGVFDASDCNILNLEYAPFSVTRYIDLMGNDNLQIDDINHIPLAHEGILLPDHLEDIFDQNSLSNYISGVPPYKREKSIEDFKLQ